MDNILEIERKLQNLKTKCDYYFSRIIGYPLSLPEHVYFALSNRCNLACKMCGISGSPDNEDEEISTEECKRIIDQIVDLEIKHLIFSGGEPLLRKDIFELISYAVNKKIKMVDIITNGLLIDPETAKKLANSGLNHITISIDGLEEANDFIRGKGSFQKAAQALNLINENKKNGFPTTGINFTIMDCNVDQILPMIDLAREKKCNIIVLQPMLCDNRKMQERKTNELWVSAKNIPKLEEVIKQVIVLKRNLENFSIHVNEKILSMIPAYFANLPLDKNLKCYECIIRIVVSHNGDLWSCGGKYGNLKKDLLRNCWFSPSAKEIRQQIKRCRNHCLQSCVHSVDLRDIYSEVRELKCSIGNDKDSFYLSRKLLGLLNKYKFLMAEERKKEKGWVRYFLNIFKGPKKYNPDELNSEIDKISKVIKDL